MRKGGIPLCGMVALCALLSGTAGAQQTRGNDPVPAAVAATPTSAAAGGLATEIRSETVQMPNLSFTPDAEAEQNYFKYFFFHREETDFRTAYADIQECDGYARGLSHRTAGMDPAFYAMQGIGGAIGGVIGNVLADAIYGSAERRRQRRVNMRTCMGFKGYRAFGLPRDVWQAFNFDEGNGSIAEDRRQELLRMQARAASGPRPTLGEMQ